MTLSVGVQALPDEPRDEVRNVSGSNGDDSEEPTFASPELGLDVAEMKAAEAEHLGFKGYEGVVITAVAPNSPALTRAWLKGCW